MQNTIIAVLVALLVGAGGGFWLGNGMASGKCARDQLDGTTQALQTATAVVEAGRESVKDLAAETAQAGQRSAAVAARQMRQRGEHEKAIQRGPVVADCGRDDVSFGVLLSAIRAANSGANPDDPGGLPGAVRTDPGTGEPGRPGYAAVGTGGGAVP